MRNQARCVVVLLLALLISANATGQTFHGHLDGSLHIDPTSGAAAFFESAPAALVEKLALEPESVDSLSSGQIELGRTPNLRFGAAIANMKDGTKLFFIDSRSGDGRIEQPRRFLFTPPTHTYYAAELQLSIPLETGPFKEVPLFVALAGKSMKGLSSDPAKVVLIVSNEPFVQGTVEIPNRSMLVRYTYSLSTASVAIDKASEWFDVNGDGRIDVGAGSPEFGAARSGPPVFNVGDIALRTSEVNLTANTVTLKVVPKDTARIQLLVGNRLPDFSFKDLQGKPHQFSDVKGRYTLLDFWATWCGPCVADLPYKRDAYRAFHAKGFQILGMNGDVGNKAPLALLQKLRATWPEAQFDKDLLQSRFAITSWPTLVLVDRDGRIVSTNQVGQPLLSGKDLNATLEKLLP